MAPRADAAVLIVGAGPSGLLLGLLLAKRSIQVHIVEREHTLDSRPRATHYGVPAVRELDRAGVLQEVREEGFLPRFVAWRKLDGTLLAGLDRSCLPEEDATHCLPVDGLCKILLRRLTECAFARISWGYKVVRACQDEENAWVDAEKSGTVQRFYASYVVGCDGASSQVRKCLFGQNSLLGRTWEQPLVATNVYYPFDKHGYSDTNFIVDPQHWHMAAKITKDGLWRVTYGELPGPSKEQMIARQPAKFEKMLPSHPKPDQLGTYKLTSISPYIVHQRCVKSMRVGRICLVGDAAHLCNPFGGLGLTGGLLDAGALYDCLSGIIEGKAEESILDRYSEIRLGAFNSIVDPTSANNLLLLKRDPQDPSLLEDTFLQAVRKTSGDAQFSREFQTGSLNMRVDMTSFYHTK